MCGGDEGKGGINIQEGDLLGLTIVELGGGVVGLGLFGWSG